MKPGQLFKSRLNEAEFIRIFELYFQDDATVSVGRDGVRLKAFQAQLSEEIAIILKKIRAGNYKFTAYREKLISKGASKAPRQISIPTIRDKLVLKFISLLLIEIYPKQASKPPHDIVKQVHGASKTRPADDYYLRLDIKNYFSSISHKILMRVLRRKIRQKEFLQLIHSAIETPTGRENIEEHRLEKGVPQGLSIANILSSIYLSDIDEKFESVPNIDYFRYVDDLLLISDKGTVDELSHSIPRELKTKRKISSHELGTAGKSICVPLTKGIDYLGYSFCRDKIEVREASFKKMFVNLMKLFTAMKYGDQNKLLIRQLNLRISGCVFEKKKYGWVFFFNQSNNLQQMKRLDAFIFSQAKKVLSIEECEGLKKFVRSYYEIRHRYGVSEYFPNFDKFDDIQKKQEIKTLLPKMNSWEVDSLVDEELEKVFKDCIAKETSKLMKDMMEVFS